MLSRIAENLYWMSRHLERANNTSRLIGINLNYLVEAEDALSESSQWKPLLDITGSSDAYEEMHPGEDVRAEGVIEYLTRGESNSSSVWNCLRSARENARTARDLISKEMWEAMNDFWLQVDRQLRDPLPLRAWPVFHKFVRNGVALFDGLSVSTMMRGESFSFHQLGTFMERADMTARILDVKYHLLLPDLSMVGSALDYYQWAALLKSISGFEAYRRKVHAGFRPIDIVEFILFETDFPRSLKHSIESLYTALKALGFSAFRHTSHGIICSLLEEWEHTQTQDVFYEIGLHEFLKKFLGQISDLHRALSQDFFTTYLGE